MSKLLTLDVAGNLEVLLEWNSIASWTVAGATVNLKPSSEVLIALTYRRFE
jgi:hypothetical protein